MTLWLRHLVYMKKNRRVCFSRDANALFKTFTHGCVIPAFYCINLNAIGSLLFLHASEGVRNGRFNGLIFLWYRYSVSIIPNKNGHRYLQYSRGIYCLPKMTFRCRSVSQRNKANLVTIVRKMCKLFELFDFSKTS